MAAILAASSRSRRLMAFRSVARRRMVARPLLFLFDYWHGGDSSSLGLEMKPVHSELWATYRFCVYMMLS